MAVAEKAATCLLDAVGLGIAAREESTFLALREVLSGAAGRTGNARLWSDGVEIGLAEAVLANAWLVHAEFHDDGEHGAWTHPGSLIVPVAVGLAEATNDSLTQALRAIACGYASLIWLGAKQRVAWGMINRGFRTSATLGRIGAAATAAVMLRLSEEQATNAIALAASTTGGTLEPVRAGTDEFRLQNAHAAHGGLLSAQLARRGVVGSPEALEGPKGLLRAFAGLEEVPPEWNEPPSSDGVFGAIVKPWAILGHSRGAIGAAKLIHDARVDVDRIQRVTIHMCRKYANYPSTLYRGPFERTVQALGSMAFATAAMLIHGELEYDMSLNRRDDPQILQLVERIRIEPDDDFSELDAVVEVELEDGAVLRRSSADVPRNVYFLDRARATEVIEQRLGRFGIGGGRLFADRIFTAVAEQRPVAMGGLLDLVMPPSSL